MKPVISIDFKKDRIRVHKITLHLIGDPEYILLLVNPEERTIAIVKSEHSVPKAIRIPKLIYADEHCFEIYSKTLLAGLMKLCAQWKNNKTYRIEGEVVRDGEVTVFNTNNFVLISEMQG